MNFITRRKADAWALLVILLFFLVFFWPMAFKGQVLVTGDALIYSYPLRLAAWAELRRGALPLWTPALLSGYPLIAMAQLALGYPLIWAYAILPGHLAEQLYVLAPFLLAPFFVYAYLREVGRSRLAALLGGLSFGYGGMMLGGLSHNGMFTNAVLWLPLLLLAIERARTRPLIPCLLGATAAYSCSVLTGLGQGFLYAGLIALAYGLFLSLFPPPSAITRPAWRDGQRWKPLAVGLGSVAAAAGVAAFQILPTLEAQRLSIRRTLTYEVFSAGSFAPREWFFSFFTPLYHLNWEVTSHLSLLTGLLALAALASAVVWRRERGRILFWFVVALLGALLMMGDHTPLYRAAYHIPVLNLFRIPWRHAFEWTFAASLLGAFGWDAVVGALARVRARRTGRLALIIAATLASGSLLLSYTVRRLAYRPLIAGTSNWPVGLAEGSLIAWKLGLTLLLVAALGWAALKLRSRPRQIALAATLIVACAWEQYLYAPPFWYSQIRPAAYFTQASPAVRFLQGHNQGLTRIYTSAASDFGIQRPQAEPHNLTAKYGLHNAAGYEPLLPQRYAQVFGSGGGFATPSFHAPTDRQILDPRWQALDLLNVKYLVEFTIPMSSALEKDGAKFSQYDNPVDLQAGQTIRLTGTREAVEHLSLVSALAHSGDIPQGEPVARVSIGLADGRRLEHEWRAGVDTAEWAHDRADVRASIQHERAPIYDSYPAEGFLAHRYWSQVQLGAKAPLGFVEITNLTRHAALTLSQVTAYDAARNEVRLLIPGLPDQWHPVYADADARIYENQRVLPRVWLAGHAQPVSEQEALRLVRGETAEPFEPRQTALLELAPERLPQELRAPPSATSSAAWQARITGYEPNGLAIETEAEQPAVLIVSEINYPGWEATLDGQRAEIIPADYLLRGMLLPAGKHRVEMRYTAPAARRGALISLVTLLVLAGLFIKTRLGGSKS